MATYYWVGGNGVWLTDTTNWASTSGGAGGAGYPTTADTVVFDANSAPGDFTVTTGYDAANAVYTQCGGIAVGNLIGNMTIPSSAFTITVAGDMNLSNVTIVPPVNITGNCNLTMSPTATISGNFGTTSGNANLLLSLQSNITVDGILFGRCNVQLNGHTINANTWNSSGITVPLDFGDTGILNITGADGDFYSSSVISNIANARINFTAVSAANRYVNTPYPPTVPDVYVDGNGTFSFSAVKNLNLSNFTGTLVTTGSSDCYVLGNLVFGAGMSSNLGNYAIQMRGTNTFIDTAGIQLSGNLACNCLGNVNTVSFPNGLSLNGTLILTSGNLDTSNANISVTSFFSSGAAVRRIHGNTSGSNAIINITGSNATVVNTSATGNLTFSGSPVWFNLNSNASTGTRTVTSNATANVMVTAGTDSFNPTSVDGLDIRNYSGTLPNATRTIGGQVFFGNTATIAAGTATTTFTGANINAGERTLEFPIAFTTPSSTLTANLVSNAAVTFTSGGLNMSNYNVTSNTLVSTSTNTISITNPGIFYVTGVNGTVVNVSKSTNTMPNLNVVLSGNASSGTRTVTVNPGLNTSANLSVTSGTDTIALSGTCDNYDFTGFAGAVSLVGNVFPRQSFTLDSNATTAGTGNLVFTSVLTGGPNTVTLTTRGVPVSWPIIISRQGGNIKLGDNLLSTAANGIQTVTGSSGFGTFDSNGHNITATSFIVAPSTFGMDGLNISNSTITLTGSGNVWSVANVGTLQATNSTIVLNSSSNANVGFNGGGYVYDTLVLGGQSSTYSLYGNGTFDTLSSNNAGNCSVLFSDGTTTTVSNWDINGTAGNLVTLSTISGANTFNLTKTGALVNAGYLNILNSAASPANTWYAGSTSTDGGNNTGWLFTMAPSGYSYNGAFFLF